MTYKKIHMKKIDTFLHMMVKGNQHVKWRNREVVPSQFLAFYIFHFLF